MYIIFKRSDDYVGQAQSASTERFMAQVAGMPNHTFEIVHTAETWDQDFRDRLETLKAETTYGFPTTRCESPSTRHATSATHYTTCNTPLDGGDCENASSHVLL